jgi:hypothetical protein
MMARSRSDDLPLDQRVHEAIRGLELPEHRPDFFTDLEEKLVSGRPATQPAARREALGAETEAARTAAAEIGSWGRKRRVSGRRRFALAACATVVVVAGVTVGVLLAVGHLANRPVLVIGGTESTTTTATTTATTASTGGPASTAGPAPTATTAATTSGASTTLALTPSQFQGASDILLHYFSTVLSSASEDFKKLIAPGSEVDAETLWQRERGDLDKLGQAAYSVEEGQNLAWLGNGYMLPWIMVPKDVDEWIRVDPANRMGLQVTMEDGTLRYLQLERQPQSDTWLAAPTQALLAFTSASTDQSQSLAEEMLAALKTQFASLAGAVVYRQALTQIPGQPRLDVTFADRPSDPAWSLAVTIQQNVPVPETGALSVADFQPVDLSGSLSGWLLDLLPESAQLIVWRPDGTMVDVTEKALKLNPGDAPPPFDVSAFEQAVQLIAGSATLTAPASVDRRDPEAVLRAYFSAWQRGAWDEEASYMSETFSHMEPEPAKSLQVDDVRLLESSASHRLFDVTFDFTPAGDPISMDAGQYGWTYDLNWDAGRQSWIITNYGAG